MIPVALLQDAAQDILPRTAEAWAFLTLAFTTIAGGIGWAGKRWSDTRVARAEKEAKKAGELASQLSTAQDRLIASAERRELEQAARTDEAIAGIAKLTTSIAELVATNRTLATEVQRANANVEYILRERK